MKGAGGTQGGIGEFLLGLIMFVVGMYLFLSNISVHNSFGMTTSILRIGGATGVDIVSGMILIPFLFGVGIIFYNKKNLIGWTLAIGSIGLLVVGMIVSLRFIFRPMNVMNLIIILVLMVGGLGLFLRSLREKS